MGRLTSDLAIHRSRLTGKRSGKLKEHIVGYMSACAQLFQYKLQGWWSGLLVTHKINDKGVFGTCSGDGKQGKSGFSPRQNCCNLNARDSIILNSDDQINYICVILLSLATDC